MPYHTEMVSIADEHGDTAVVYRYLRKCKHCCGWECGSASYGRCTRLDTMTSAEKTTCDQFLATEEGLVTIWIETEARIGDQFCRINYKGKSHFLEKESLVKALGYDPDEDDERELTRRERKDKG